MFSSQIHPICDRCDKPIDYIETYYDILNRFTICYMRCHGEEQEFYLSDLQIKTASSIKMGRAFTTKKIEEAKSNEMECV